MLCYRQEFCAAAPQEERIRDPPAGAIVVVQQTFDVLTKQDWGGIIHPKSVDPRIQNNRG